MRARRAAVLKDEELYDFEAARGAAVRSAVSFTGMTAAAGRLSATLGGRRWRRGVRAPEPITRAEPADPGSGTRLAGCSLQAPRMRPGRAHQQFISGLESGVVGQRLRSIQGTQLPRPAPLSGRDTASACPIERTKRPAPYLTTRPGRSDEYAFRRRGNEPCSARSVSSPRLAATKRT